MFEIIEKSHFLFSGLDPDYEKHTIYKTGTTTGALQMSMATVKPLIIEKSFADFYNLDNSNAIVYVGNKDFASKFKLALDMKPNEFNTIQENILKTRKSLENETQNILRNFLS